MVLFCTYMKIAMNVFLFNLSRHRQFTGMHKHKHIYKHIFVELFLSVLQCACDQRETQDYNGGPHGAYKGVDGRGVATRIPSLMENDSMFFMELRLAITRFLCQHVKKPQMEICAKSLSAVWNHRWMVLSSDGLYFVYLLLDYLYIIVVLSHCAYVNSLQM